MAKSLMYRLFGIGKVPKKSLSILKDEGILYMEEGIPASIGFRNFRAPGKYYGRKRNWFSGSIVLTDLHFLAFSAFNTTIGIKWDEQKIRALNCYHDGKNRLCITYDASVFNDDWSGEINLCYASDETMRVLSIIQDRIKVPDINNK